MSFITRELRFAADRLSQWLMPPAVRRYVHPRPGARVFRYPAPGSEPAEWENNYIDYKTAYRDSTHHIRHETDSHTAVEGYNYLHDPLTETTAEKLIRYGYLKPDQVKDNNALDAATKQYEKEVGEAVTVRVHHDDFGFSDQPITRDNVESVSEYIASLFEGVKQGNATEAWLNDLDDIYNAHFYYLKTFDMAADDPVYRQLTMDLVTSLDDIGIRREELQNFPVFKSNPAYWAILDDSFSAENIKRVQASVKNFTGHTDLTPVYAKEGEIPISKGQPAVMVPIQSQFVED